ncbi:hypothetical protein chiPu_0025059 [Chiloscyllium punctatum]|uniref:Uncharacterized protein n=1 Tax=Chiloscyllium punctatum TaxID=137246 RepID=A0A401TEY3_CHIPU|nr:hypothetical protein [Chiloscyllium punctatum]
MRRWVGAKSRHNWGRSTIGRGGATGWGQRMRTPGSPLVEVDVRHGPEACSHWRGGERWADAHLTVSPLVETDVRHRPLAEGGRCHLFPTPPSRIGADSCHWRCRGLRHNPRARLHLPQLVGAWSGCFLIGRGGVEEGADPPLEGARVRHSAAPRLSPWPGRLLARGGGGRSRGRRRRRPLAEAARPSAGRTPPPPTTGGRGKQAPPSPTRHASRFGCAGAWKGGGGRRRRRRVQGRLRGAAVTSAGSPRGGGRRREGENER